MIIKNKQWRLAASFFCLVSPLSFAQSTVPVTTEAAPAAEQVTAPALQPFNAVYEVFRSGEKHGDAERYLNKTENGYELG